ncbi:hypothetical protein [Microvirga sp. P5_D2]
MFDEDDEKRFPRLTLWQFTKGFFSTIFLATGWLASLGSSFWSFLVLWLWSEHAETKLGGRKHTGHGSHTRSPKEKGPPSEP